MALELGEQSLQELAQSSLVNHFDYNVKYSIGFCIHVFEKKNRHRSPFE